MAGTQFSRAMDEINRGAEGLATVIFPYTIKQLQKQAFNGVDALRSVVPSEELAEIGE